MDRPPNSIHTVGSGPPLTTTPTTFVQADAHTFRDLVQKLTGATDDTPDKLPITVPARFSAARSPDIVGPRRSTFKLHERRHSMRKLEIKLGLTSLRSSSSSPASGSFSPRSQPSVSPIPSPVTPLGSDPLFSGHFLGSGSESPSSVSEEEKAIAEKGFYLHPSPLSTPRGPDPPELLPLFPLQSPRQKE
ncbi:VQ motif-containing protein 4-like [Magnolia sinica]|uniref:VQ motif-containing protein 4-like n=1 Tax=Magnolia sinica TaxID=86752 RepID=UPI00265B055C|nr:VQ motif-containing protein 4-like [Magnolia sinica]